MSCAVERRDAHWLRSCNYHLDSSLLHDDHRAAAVVFTHDGLWAQDSRWPPPPHGESAFNLSPSPSSPAQECIADLLRCLVASRLAQHHRIPWLLSCGGKMPSVHNTKSFIARMLSLSPPKPTPQSVLVVCPRAPQHGHAKRDGKWYAACSRAEIQRTTHCEQAACCIVVSDISAIPTKSGHAHRFTEFHKPSSQCARSVCIEAWGSPLTAAACPYRHCLSIFIASSSSSPQQYLQLVLRPLSLAVMFPSAIIIAMNFGRHVKHICPFTQYLVVHGATG